MSLLDINFLAVYNAIAAIKYADMLPNRTSDYIFDPVKFSETTGKTGPYLLYNTVRIKSIFTKVYRRVEEVDSLIDDDKEENILLFNKILHQELSDINKLKQEKNECLKFINVTKNFESVNAVDNFNAELFSDEIFCLLGNNGAGKTTLINMISRIIKPTHGDIYFNDTSIVNEISNEESIEERCFF